MEMGSGVEVVNTFLSGMVTHFEQEGVPVHQVNDFSCLVDDTNILYGTILYRS